MTNDRFIDVNDDFYELVDRYLSGELTPGESEKLQAILAVDPDRANVLCENVLVDYWFRKQSCIRADEQAVPGYLAEVPQPNDFEDLVRWEQEVVPRQRVLKPRTVRGETGEKPLRSRGIKRLEMSATRQRRFAPFTTALLLLLVIGGLGRFYYNQTRIESPASVYVPYATVAETIDVKWLDNVSPYKKGQELGKAELAFSGGMVKLEFKDGTELILEGPARFVIAGEKNTFCNRGKISAHVPKSGVGFQITTPLGTVVDRGTEFVLEVARNHTQVDVVTGLVDLYTPSRASVTRIKEGEAAAVNELNVVRRMTAERDRYVGSSLFLSIQTAQAQRRRKEFEERAAGWNAHPHLLTRFDMSSLTGKTLENMADAGKKLVASASVDDCRLTRGFYIGTAAVRFNDKGGVHFDLPGAFRSLSLVASVRVDDLRGKSNVIMASSDFYTAPGTLLWQILPTGAFQVQITPGNRSQTMIYSSDPFYWPKQWRTWSSLAVVLDADRKVVAHYYDGRLVAEVPWKTPVPLYVGKASLGNMQRSLYGLSPLYLNGAIDDFQIYDKALTAGEIAKLLKTY